MCGKRSFIRKIFNLSSFSSSTQSQVKPNRLLPLPLPQLDWPVALHLVRMSTVLASSSPPLSLFLCRSLALPAPCMCANLSNIVPFPYAFHLSIFCLYFSSARRLLQLLLVPQPVPLLCQCAPFQIIPVVLVWVAGLMMKGRRSRPPCRPEFVTFEFWFDELGPCVEIK